MCRFVDNLLGVARVRRVALDEHTVRPYIAELGQGLLGFILTSEVMDGIF
jgi:hypothetical protein